MSALLDSEGGANPMGKFRAADPSVSAVEPRAGAVEPRSEAAGSERAAVGRLAVIAVGAYMAVVFYLMIVVGVWPTLDLVAIAIGLLAIALGRARLFFRDWLPFVLIFLAWEAMRGLADNFGAAVHSDSVIALERALFFGIVPPVELQRLWHRPEAASALDIATSLLYAAHFIFPLGVAFLFWLRDRRRFYQFAATLLLMALVAFVVYLLVPVAPPRFAYRHGEALVVHDVIGNTIHNVGLETSADWIYENLSPNDNAAFPSLHAAFPLLAVLFLWRRHRRVAVAVLGYTAAVWFAIVYTGHHYVVDIVGGVAFAVAAYLIVVEAGILDRLLARLMRPPSWRTLLGRSAREPHPPPLDTRR
jgi:membrane-associated phospholipid phosphatase